MAVGNVHSVEFMGFQFNRHIFLVPFLLLVFDVNCCQYLRRQMGVGVMYVHSVGFMGFQFIRQLPGTILATSLCCQLLPTLA